MKLLPSWIREFVNIPVDDRQLADDLTMAGISVEGIDETRLQRLRSRHHPQSRRRHEPLRRRARCAAVYNVDLKSIAPKLRSTGRQTSASIFGPEQCARYSSRIVRGVTIKPSPEYISRRLTLLGRVPSTTPPTPPTTRCRNSGIPRTPSISTSSKEQDRCSPRQ